MSCSISLHAACSTAEHIAFRQINKATGMMNGYLRQVVALCHLHPQVDRA